MGDVLVKYGTIPKLSKRFGVSDRTIHSALKGETKSKLANEIRAAAINEFGGRSEKTQKIVIIKNK